MKSASGVSPLGAGMRRRSRPPSRERLGRGDQPVGLHVELHGAGAEEVLERRVIAARARQLLGEAGAGDDGGARLAHGAEAAHVIPVAVGENDVLDRGARDLLAQAPPPPRARSPRWCRRRRRPPSRATRRTPGSRSRSPRRRRRRRPREPGASRRSGSRCVASTERFPSTRGVVRSSSEPSPARASISRERVLVAERAIGGGQARDRCRVRTRTEAGRVGERELEVVDRRARLAEAGRQLGEHQAAREPAEHRIGGGAVVELADGVLDPGHALEQGDLVRDPRLHGRLAERGTACAGGLLDGEPPEVLVALPLAVAGQQLLHGREDEDACPSWDRRPPRAARRAGAAG